MRIITFPLPAIVSLKTTILLSALIFLSISCKKEFSDPYTYNAPEQINDGLQTGTLEQVGVNSDMLAKAVGRIRNDKYGQVHAMLIYKDDLLVFEEYFEGNKYQWDAEHYRGERIQWDKNNLHVIMSCTKSFTSALVGIALDKDYIESVDESIFNYLPDHQMFKKEGKDAITIKHLLTMTSGLSWEEWGAHAPSSNDLDRLYSYCQSDPVACVLEKPLDHNPGTQFKYNSGGMIILGEIIRNATQMNIEDFSVMYLFQPLGIDSVNWYQFENGVYASDGSLVMTPRDMLKLGVTYLNKGIWKNEKIIPEYWVEKSRSTYNNNTDIDIPIDDSGKNGYSYSWWTNIISAAGKSAELFQAGGWGGQEIIVIPELNMVVVFTGGNYEKKKHYYEILERFVLPAIN